MVAEAPLYTPEDEAFAESLVDEALLPYKSLPAHVLDEMREFLVDELLATEDGRRRLRLAKPYAGDASKERNIGAAAVAELDKAKGEK